MATIDSAGDEVPRQTYLVLGVTLILVAAAFVSLRLVTNIVQNRKLDVEDYLSIVGLVFTTAKFAVNYYIILGFLDPTTTTIWSIRMGVAVVIIILFALWTTKAPILLLYVRLFGVEKWLRWCSHITLAVSAVLFIAAMAISLAKCDLRDEGAAPQSLTECINASAVAAIFSGYVAIATDLIIFCLPIPAILRLKLPLSKRIGLGAVFFSGLLGIVASIVSVVYKYRASDPAATLGTRIAIMTWIVIECVTAIVVACAPATKVFFSKFVFRSTSASSNARSTLTQLSFSRPHKSRRSQKHNPGDSTDAINDGNDAGGTYILMESSPRNFSR